MRPRFIIFACIVGLVLAAIVRNEQATMPPRVEASARPAAPVPAVTISERDRDEVYSYYGIDHPDGGCPAGLVKKVNGCLPVGGGRGSWVLGRPLPNQVILYPLPAVLLGQITPPPFGYRYARVGDDVLIIATETRVVVGAIAATADNK
jgi:hypothetical protein